MGEITVNKDVILDKPMEDKRTPVFSFMVEGMSQDAADILLDMMCLYVESHGLELSGSMRMLTNDEIIKENGGE